MSKPSWKIRINFIPFETEEKRGQAYEMWAKSFRHLKNKDAKGDQEHLSCKSKV